MQVQQSPRVEGIRTAAAVVVVIAGLKLGSAVLIPVLMAGFFAMALMPLAVRLEKRGLPAWLATILAFLLGAALIGMLGYLVASSLDNVRRALPGYGARLDDILRNTEAWLQNVAHNIGIGEGSGASSSATTPGAETAGSPEDVPAGPRPSGLEGIIDPDDLLGYVQSLITSLASVLSQSVVVILIMLFMLFERSVVTGSVRGELEVSRRQQILQRIASSVTDYLSVKTVISLITGVLFGLYCWWLGIDFPMLWGLLAFLLNYIPTIGSIIACIPPALVALVQFGWDKAFLVVIGNIVLNSTLGNVIEPKIMGNKVGLSALTIFVGLLFWSWVFGPVGALLSVPLTIIVKMLLEPPPTQAQAQEPAPAVET